MLRGTPSSFASHDPEYIRICKLGGRMLFLTLAKGLMNKAIESREDLTILNQHDVYVGGFEVALYHLQKVSP